MKRFKEDDFNEKIENCDKTENSSTPDVETSYKKFENDGKKDEIITPNMKNFRRIIGGLILVFIACFLIFSNDSSHTNYKSNLKSGKIESINVGDRISKKAVKLQANDFSIDQGNSYGKIELSVWNFADEEDGDYVQVFVNGYSQTEPFAIRHKPIKIEVPDKSIIQVRGIRDGGNNGITYGLFFNKTGETYLNTVPLNLTNTYTLKTSK
ncbi:hypothetical protein [Clostridium tyrobutyricum]|uniref:hypothetical protein n=1 Tax=Clostridium tyrobutyricum TaxID=1519 RepID=UPI00241BFC84|nr:hypothetical protein [Clostridium tyrobutyricum]